MVFEEIIAVAPELQEPIAALVRILQIVGGVFALWVILWAVSLAVNLYRAKLLVKMLDKLEENNQKLDRLFRKK